jgi:hypothetical protein
MDHIDGTPHWIAANIAGLESQWKAAGWHKEAGGPSTSEKTKR